MANPRSTGLWDTLKQIGLGDLPRTVVTRGAPTREMERQGNVIAGVRSLEEALRKIGDLAPPPPRKAK